MKRSISLLAAAAIGVGILATSAAAERRFAEAKAAAPAPSREHVQKTLDALVAAGAPGAVLLMRDGAHRVVMTAGLADTRTRTPMRADDRFRPGHARLARTPLVKADPELGRVGVVLGQPASPFGRVPEEPHLVFHAEHAT